MDPPHPSPHHHHRLHLRLDPGHHHRIHIHLCHHTTQLLPTPAATSAHHHQHHQQPALVPPHSFPYPPTAAPWIPEAQPAGPQGEAAEDPAPQAEPGEEVYLEEEEEEEEPVFVLTDEWAEFFAKADAKRKLAKQKNRKKWARQVPHVLKTRGSNDGGGDSHSTGLQLVSYRAYSTSEFLRQ